MSAIADCTENTIFDDIVDAAFHYFETRERRDRSVVFYAFLASPFMDWNHTG